MTQLLFGFAALHCRWCKREIDPAASVRGVGGFRFCDEEHAQLEADQYIGEEDGDGDE